MAQAIAALIVCACVIVVATICFYFAGDDAFLYILLGGILYASVVGALK